MKLKLELAKKIILALLFAFILITFIIVLVKLPANFNLDINLKEFKIDSNVKFTEIKDGVVDYYKNLFSGSLGQSSRTIPVWDYVKDGFFNSARLLFGALGLAIGLGIIKGIFDSKKDKQVTSTLRLMPTLIGLSMPDIFVIIVLQSFVVWLHRQGFTLLPVAGYGTFAHAILPTIALAIIPMMYIARITALSIDNIYNEEYIRTSFGKGASKFRVIFIHVLRNAIVEISDSFSSIVSMLISSLLLVEYFFYYPGLTLVMYNNYLSGEKDVVIGIALVIGVIYLTLTLLFKILRYNLNPKARRG